MAVSAKTILIVDDISTNRTLLSSLVEQEYEVLEASNGLEALQLVYENLDSLVLILLDIVMPVLDGYEVLRRLKSGGILERIPVMIITATDSADIEKAAEDLGAMDIVSKPFDYYIMRQRIRNIIELYAHKNSLEGLVESQTQELRKQTTFLTRQGYQLRHFNHMMIDALSTVIEYRNLESGQHIKRIRHFTKVLLDVVANCCPEQNLTKDIIDIISSACALHDVGKIAIPDAVLLKPGPLTPEEFAIIKTHPERGCEILSTLVNVEDQVYLQYCYEICRYHHEKWDGKGYPEGLRGDEIPLSAQVVSIADCYDALTSSRVYKPPYSHEQATRMILEGQCGQFCPRLLACFKEALESFKSLASYYSDESPFDGRSFSGFVAYQQPDADSSSTRTTLTRIVSGIMHSYLEDQNLSALAEVMSDSVSWMGSRIGEMTQGSTQLLELMMSQKSCLEDAFHVIDEWYDVQALYAPIYIVFGEMSFTTSAPEAAAAVAYVRVTAILHQLQDEFKVIHLHTSFPDYSENSCDLLDRRYTKMENKMLEQVITHTNLMLTDHQDQLQEIAEFAGVATLRLRIDSALTIKSYGAGLPTLFGIPELQLQGVMRDGFASIIAPKQRIKTVALLSALKKQPNRSLNLQIPLLWRGPRELTLLLRAKAVQVGDAVELDCVLVNQNRLPQTSTIIDVTRL